AKLKNITAESGLNVTLPCRAPNNNILISVVEWSRPDLKRDEYVILYRDNQLHPDYQDPSFKGRVDLQDNQMKDGDVSLVLKDVTISDAGTYECRIIQRTGTTRMKRTWLTTDPINIINLSVVPSGEFEFSVCSLKRKLILVCASVITFLSLTPISHLQIHQEDTERTDGRKMDLRNKQNKTVR
uniref:Ig-like domain-containing protein n=1 Tax=Maylandia zebra TaxID=106582 RepID=A0A3P9AZC6_9CICH